MLKDLVIRLTHSNGQLKISLILLFGFLFAAGCGSTGQVSQGSAAAAAAPTASAGVTLAPTLGGISPTVTQLVTVIPTRTSLAGPIGFPTGTRPAVITPTSEVSGTPGAGTPDLADFPATILYQGFGGGGPGINCDQAEQQSARGLLASTFDDPRALHTLGICIWGLPLGTVAGLAVASPDGSQIFSEGFSTVKQADGSYIVQWPGISPAEWDSNIVHMYPDGKAEIDLYLWWPGGMPAGDWSVVVTAGNQTIYGRLRTTVPHHPWVSLQPFDDKLYLLPQECLSVSGQRRDQPLQMAGGGFPPGQAIQLGLYYQSTLTADYQRVDVSTSQADSHGEIALTLQAEPSDPAGTYRLVALTDETRPFFQQADINALIGGSDCFFLH